MELVKAGTWEQDLSSQFTSEYDSNPTMSPNNPEGAWRGLFEPSYTLLGRYGQDEYKSGVSMQMSRSSDEVLSPNRNSPSVFIDLLHRLEESEFGINTRYSEIATRDAGVDAAGHVPVSSTRVSRSVSGRLTKRLSERGVLSADSAYEGIAYQGGTFIDYAIRTTNLMYSYAWSEYNTPYFQATRIVFEPAVTGFPSSFTNTLVLGLNWKLTSNIEGNVHVGKSNINDDEVGTQGAASILYNGLRNRLTLNISHQVTPSGLGGFANIDQVDGSWNLALSERKNIGIDLMSQRSHYTVDNSNSSASIWLQYEINTFWGLRTYLRQNSVSGDVIETAYANILGVVFSYTHNDF